MRRRESGPRFADNGSFEYEYGEKWKQLYEMKKQKLEALEREMKLEEDKLIAQMEFARYEHETETLKVQLQQREEMRGKMMEMEQQRRMEQEQDMMEKMRMREEGMMKRQEENSMFMQAQELNTMLDNNVNSGMGGGFGG